MKSLFIPILIWCSLLMLACNEKTDSPSTTIDIVPKPQSYTLQKGHFTLKNTTAISADATDPQIDNVVRLLRNTLQPSTGYALERTDEPISKNAILLQLSPNEPIAPEGYRLKADPQKVVITAATPAGLFYGAQSLLQLLPPEAFSSERQEGITWTIPCVEITDEPAFSHRGSHLDVCRHFFSLDSVKRHIDHIARYKLNRFHWHLTDDQGWRIEIKAYPKLTEIGGCRKETLIGHYSDEPRRFDGKKYCGFYTQEEAREIVAYAAERFITVIPEIELPGHARAALSAYPEMSCNPSKKHEAATFGGVHDEVFCPNETTFTILEGVFKEIMEIFPSEYIHIGGDECPKKEWKESRFCQDLMKQLNLKTEEELQSYFVKRMQKYLNDHGRKIIGWDEIMEGGLAEGATVMSWRGIEGGIEAAEAGHDVIMAPTSHCYFDYYQADPKNEPLAIGGFTTINKVYHFNPIPDALSADKRHHILGPQCNLWTEYIPTYHHAEYMLFPRMLALAEVAWTKLENKDWEDFCRRLPRQLELLDNYGANHGSISFNITFAAVINDASPYAIRLSSENAGADIVYTTDGTEPCLQSQRYTAPITVSAPMVLKAVPVYNNTIQGKVQEKAINYHKAVGKDIAYEKPADSKYPGGGKYGLVDGMTGSGNFGDGFWQGYFGNDCNVVIDMKEPQPLSKLSVSALQSTTSWILFPESVSFYASNDGDNWTILGKEINNVGPMENGNLIKDFSVTTDTPEAYRYVRVDVTSRKTCPKGHVAEGSSCWIFVDEIVIE